MKQTAHVSTVTVSLVVSPETLHFPAAGGAGDLTLSCLNNSWEAVSSESWVTVTPASGSADYTQSTPTIKTLTVTVTPNTSSRARMATLTFTGATGLITRTVTVTQDAAGITPTLTVSATGVEMAAGGGSQEITIQSNTGWTAAGSEAWVSVSPASDVNNGTVNITATANTTKIHGRPPSLSVAEVLHARSPLRRPHSSRLWLSLNSPKVVGA